MIVASLKMMAIVLWTIPIIIMQVPAKALRLPIRWSVPKWWHRGVGRIIGLRLQVHGRRTKHRPTLYVANHCSYLDILVLGSVITGSFISKAEVAKWPIFGFLASLQNTVFIERNPKLARAQQGELEKRLASKDSLILFPEGTSTAATGVFPFKSTLFSIAEKKEDLLVQPVTVSYTAINGIPVTRIMRPYLSWFGNMGLGAHLWALLQLGTVQVTMVFHEPVLRSTFPDRKALARHCQERVAEGLWHIRHTPQNGRRWLRRRYTQRTMEVPSSQR